jgi:flagella basal body P-ring formation protein FlgA
VRVLVDGEVYRTIWTSWQVELFEARVVLARDVAAGEPLGGADFAVERVRVASSEASAPLSAPMLAGAVALRSLDRGTVLSAADVRRPEIVRRGDVVYLAVKKGAITARVAARALEGGRMHERIRIVLPPSGRELAALVLGRDTVELDLSPSIQR